MLTKTRKTKIVEEFKVHEADTGSPEVQVAILTRQIEELTKHLKKHAKDNHSRRGLLKMVARRKKMLDYLKKEDETRYASLIKKLGLKKWPRHGGIILSPTKLDEGSYCITAI